MIKNIPCILACALLMLQLNSCKKSDILKDEAKKAGKSAINKELVKLAESLEDADTDFDRAVIHTKIAELQSAKGDVAGTMKSSWQAVKFQPNQNKGHYLLGKSYCEAGRYNEAFQELATALDLNPDYAPAHFEMGNVYYKKNQFAQAIAEYNMAVAKDPKHIMAYNNLGVLYNALGNAVEAENAFMKIVTIEPAFAVAYKNLAILYDIRLNDKVKALQYYKKYLSLRPDCPERVLLKSWIAGLGG